MRLVDQHCVPGAPALGQAEAKAFLLQIPAWQMHEWQGGARIERGYVFANYHETIAFVNALAWMVHGEDHHPDLQVGYRHCTVSYTTHSAGNGVSLNDFLCAAKADAIYEQGRRA